MLAGLEGLHSWTPPGATEPAIELNRTHDDSGVPVWPRFVLSRITGLGSLGEPDDGRDRPPGSPREIVRPSVRRGRSVAYEGELRARTLLELREAEATFRAAFAAVNAEGRVDVFWHPLNTEFKDVPPKFYEARALTADIVDAQGSTRWSRPFVVGLRQSDARYFDDETEVHEVTMTTINTTYDFT